MSAPSLDKTIHGSPSEDDVVWFGVSRRTIGSQPDSRYGWLQTATGVCIVKAMNPELVAYNATLLEHERYMLERLQVIGAPSPTPVEFGRKDWLVTRFAGLSLQRLRHGGGLQGCIPAKAFPGTEALAAWVHLLRRLQPMADRGVLAIDLYDANVVLPLTQGTAGQLRLHEALLIDHAHTLETGMDLRRPVWLDRGMNYIAPELREALRADQEALVSTFRMAGAELPGYSRLPTERDQLSRRVWAEYDAPQALQRLLDAGNLSRDHAMQFAAGIAIESLLKFAPTESRGRSLAAVQQRMTASNPCERFDKLTDAADAIASALGSLPMVSGHAFAPLRPEDLSLASAKDDSEATAMPDPSSPTPHGSNNRPAQEAGDTSSTVIAGQSGGLGMGWWYAAAAAGAAVGALVPMPW